MQPMNVIKHNYNKVNMAAQSGIQIVVFLEAGSLCFEEKETAIQ